MFFTGVCLSTWGGGEGLHSGGAVHPGEGFGRPPHWILRDAVNKRPVSILLEYILVFLILLFCGFRISKFIHFYDLDNPYRVVSPKNCYVQPVNKWASPGHMTSTSELLFCETRSQIICVDCSKCDPIILRNYNSFRNIQGLCCMSGSAPYLVVADDEHGLLCHKYQLERKRDLLNINLVWCVKGRLHLTDADFRAGKVVYGNNQLFVHDLGNNCIRTFNKDGIHTGRLLTAGRDGIGSRILDIGWQQPTSALLIAHANDNDLYRYSRIDVHYGTITELPLPTFQN